MEFKDYYQVLGVERSASADEIKKAYRRAARKFHPDVSKEADAAARMSEVNEAYTVLSDAEKRATYDALGNRFGAGDPFEPPPGAGQRGRARARPHGQGAQGGAYGGAQQGPHFASEEEFSDFFSSMFGRGRAGASRGGGGGDPYADLGPIRGEDRHASVSIDLADSYHGTTRSLTMRDARLNEQGQVVHEDRTLEVKIPRGVTEGQRIRLSGQGSPGFNGGAAGDLYLEVQFNQDARYRVQGKDVTIKLPVSPWEAALGAQIEVRTLAGHLQVAVPADSQAGRRLRLRGKGLPASTPGDLYLELEVVLPAADNDKARALYQTMAKEMAFNPRRSMEA